MKLFFRRAHPGQFSIERVFADVAGAFRHVEAEACVPPVHSKGLANRLRLLAWAWRNRGEVNHVTGDISFVTLALPRRRTVLTVHDIGHLYHQKGLRRALYLWLWIRLPISRAAVVTVVSAETKRLIQKETGCRPEKVRVIHNSVSAGMTPWPRRFNGECCRILQIGTKANKNLARVLPALSGLPVRLVVVGRMDEDLRRLARTHGVEVENHVDLSDQQVIEQYRMCDLVMVASTTEGFGMPIIEGQSIGRPVVVSAIEPLTDVAGPGACFVDPTSVASIREGVERLIGDAEYRRTLIARGQANVERFSRSAIARQYEDIYLSLPR